METLQPKLRFLEFNGNWESKILEEVSNINMGQSPSSTSYNTEKIGMPLIQGNADIKNRFSFPRNWTNEPTKICDIGDLILTVRAPVGAVAKSNHQACIGRGVCSIKNKTNSNIDFIYQFLLDFENKWGEIEQGSTFTAVSGNEIKKLKLKIPSIQEQTKIANFLSSIDEKINLLKEKKELLEEYKKGIMQKIFHQEIRFKDEKGKDFESWIERYLGEIGNTFNGLTGKTKENFGIGGKPYIQYKQIFDNSKINIEKCELVEITENDNQNSVQYGDVFFTISSETPNEIGTASVLLDEVEEMYLNSFCFGYRANSLMILVPEFSRYLFRSELFRNDIVKLAQGSTRYNMSKIELMKLKILLPKAEEQIKIANFLSAIDEKIELVATQIQDTQEYKKGLLQQMFI
jgi:type I restriction enzyme S subunit